MTTRELHKHISSTALDMSQPPTEALQNYGKINRKQETPQIHGFLQILYSFSDSLFFLRYFHLDDVHANSSRQVDNNIIPAVIQ